MIHALYSRGIHLPAHQLWMDPATPQPSAFISHAHSDHIARHHRIIATPTTLRLLQLRLPSSRSEVSVPYLTPFSLPAAEGILLPAGHVAGSAQIWIQSDSSSLLYTGDFKLRPSYSTETIQWRQADTLVMETTFGLPRYQLPPTEHTLAQIVAFCTETLSAKGVPVLLAYSLGKAQEILCALLLAGLTPILHRSVWEVTEIYRELQPGFPTGYRPLHFDDVEGHVLICPPSVARSGQINRIQNRRTAMLTGWALDPSARFRYRTDAAFPLSDHADYTDLLRYVELVQPKRVLTLHGFASEFAADLRRRGIEAWALNGDNQLELHLN